MARMRDIFHRYWLASVVFTALSPAAIVALCYAGLPLQGLIAPCTVIVAANICVGRAIARETNARLASADTALRSAESVLMESQTDPVTAIFNRAGGQARLAGLAEHLPPDEILMLMWIDLRRFRETNDRLGYAAGDEVLRQIALRLQGAAPPNSLIARHAGDRFLLAVRQPSASEAQELATRIDDTLAAPLHIAGHRVANGVAIGGAIMPDDAKRIDQLQRAADLALYYARTAVQGHMHMFDSSMIRPAEHEKQAQSELRDAMLKDELSIVFQPVVDLRSGKSRAFEAQARWLHPRKGELTGDQIMAECHPGGTRGGPIITLGNWVIAEAAKAAKQWPDDVLLTVKFAPGQISAPGAALGVLAALSEAALEPSRLQIQVNGDLLQHDSDEVCEFVEHLDDAGVRICVEDPVISCSAIRRIRPATFSTASIRMTPDGDVALRAMATLGRQLGVEMLVAGLEKPAQFEAARSAGCALGQGGQIGSALCGDEALERLAREQRPTHQWGAMADKLAS